MSSAFRYLAAPLSVLAVFGLVFTASADPFANVVVTLPPEGVGDVFSPGVVSVDSLTVGKSKSMKSKKSTKSRKSTKGSRAYIEEEYFVEGTADVFMYDDPPVLHDLILRNDVPTDYKTRFIIRRPESAKRFKGTLVVEWWNSTAGFDTSPSWDASAEHFAQEGWVYVGISNSNQVFGFLTTGCAIIPGLTPPTCGTRYTGLSLPENGIAYEMVSQIVNLLRGDDPQNPLLGYKIKRVLHAGQSQQAGSVNTYAREFHDPAFSDGYFIQAGAGTGRSLSTGSPVFGFGDPRGLPPTDLDVPVIRAQTETEVELFGVVFNRQADTPTFRYYEIAGATHLTVHKDVEIIPPGVFGPFPITLEDLCLNELNTLVDGPVFGKYVYNAMWANLDKQAKNIAKEMPVGDVIELTPAFAISRDADSNAVGGIRLPDMNVPTGSYFMATNVAKPDCFVPPDFLFPPACNPLPGLGDLVCLLGGSTDPFDQATLDALYPTNKDYVDLVKKDAKRLRKAKFLTKEGKKEIVARAKASGIPN